MNRNLTTLILLLLIASSVHAQKSEEQPSVPTSRGIFTLEAGALYTRNFSISGFQQANATRGWSSTAPDFRLEYWRGGGERFKQGWVFQPLDVTYRERLTTDLTVKGQTYLSGSETRLRYQFPSVRWSANRRVLASHDGKDELRVGGSVIVRYADVDFSTPTGGFHDRNLIFFPLLNLEAAKQVRGGWSLFSRVDVLPSPTGGLLLDGLLDGIVGIRKTEANGRSTDLGFRLVMGGYDPNKAGDYANRINYSALVIRRNF